MIIRKINRDEYLEAQKVSIVAFECKDPTLPESNEELLKRVESNPQSPAEKYWDDRYAAFDDSGKMAASMVVMRFSAYFDGHEVPMNGIGDVSTLPQYRRGGAIRGCFVKALEDMYKRGDVFSYLYPFSYYFYRKFGYELSAETAVWKVALRSLPKFGIEGTFEMYEPGDDMTAFNEAYDSFAKGINLMVKRDEVLWKRRVTSFSPYNSGQWSFVWKDENSQPRGYMIYKTDMHHGKRIMTLRDLGFADVKSLCAMLEFLSTFSSQYEFATIPLPPHVSLTGLIPELQYGQVTRTMEFTGMARIVNVKKAFKLAKCKGSGKITVAVDDDTIENNTGIYQIKFNDGVVTDVTVTDEEPDIETDIQNLSRLLTGAMDLADSALFPKVKIIKNIDELSKVFYKKPLWINDYF